MSNKQSSLLSTRVTQTAAGTPTQVPLDRGKQRIIMGTLEVATTDLDANDTIMLCGLHSSDVVTSIRIMNDDLDSGAGALVFNLNLYNDADGTSLKLSQAYASLFADAGAIAAPGTELAFEARDISKVGQRVWQDAGDTVDPQKEYFLGLLVQTAPSTPAAGTISFIVELANDA